MLFFLFLMEITVLVKGKVRRTKSSVNEFSFLYIVPIGNDGDDELGQ